MAWIECKMGNTDAIVKNVPWYGTCATAQGTQAKVATTSNSKFTLVTGAKVAIKFTYGNTASNPTLNVDSKGAKYIKAYGTTAPSIYWQAGDTVIFIYDGTNWIMVASGAILQASYDAATNKDIIVANWISALSNINGIFRRIGYTHHLQFSARIAGGIGAGQSTIGQIADAGNYPDIHVIAPLTTNTGYSGNIQIGTNGAIIIEFPQAIPDCYIVANLVY